MDPEHLTWVVDAGSGGIWAVRLVTETTEVDLSNHVAWWVVETEAPGLAHGFHPLQ